MRKLLLLLLGLLLIFILSYFCLIGKSEGIQSDLLGKAQTLYSEESMSWVTADIEGKNLESTRIITLTGTTTNESEKEKAEMLALNIEGVTSVNNQIVVSSSPSPNQDSIALVNPYILDVTKTEENKITLSGYVPTVEVHQELVSKAESLYGKENVTDELKEVDNAPTAWSNSVALGLEKLSLMDYGHFNMKDETFNFEGYVGSEVKKEELLSTLKGTLASNYTDTYNIKAPEPKEVVVSSNALTCQESFKEELSQEKINFAYNKAIIKKKSYQLLNKLIDIAQGCPTNKIIIEGHTDSDGSEKYNQKLSEKRANAVKAYLVKHGIAKERLESIGYGELQPIATNSTKAGKKQNRRIEFNVKGVK